MTEKFDVFDVDERVFVSFWEKGFAGGQWIAQGGGDPEIHKLGLYWVKGTVIRNDDTCSRPVAIGGAVGWMQMFDVRLDRRSKWYQLFRPVVRVPSYRLRKLSTLDLLSEV